MSATCVIGLQWGDEAKGKIVDLLTGQNDVVVRYQGGANAGHTVVFDGQKYKLSLIPSGIFRTQVQSVIADGVVIDPASLLGEIDGLTGRGIEISRNLMISNRAHVIFPWHKEEDRLMNVLCGGEAIGTTMRGIGPCYRDKLGRSLAVRIGDLYRDDLAQRIERIAKVKNLYLPGMATGKLVGTVPTFDPKAICQEYRGYADRLAPYIADTDEYLLNAVDAGKKILFEGAQGALLDIDHGTFPYVTSSNSAGGSISAGSGVPSNYIQRVIGVVKAYTTRVGGGPFPTELDDEVGQKIRDRGNEYGTVTKRPRRCGWFDAVAARYTARLSGATEIACMLLDVLSTFDTLHVCTAYQIDGKTVTSFPADVDCLRAAKPVYEAYPGWSEDITGARTFEELPDNAKKYIKRLGEILQRRISMVSVGPSREQTIDVPRL